MEIFLNVMILVRKNILHEYLVNAEALQSVSNSNVNHNLRYLWFE